MNLKGDSDFDHAYVEDQCYKNRICIGSCEKPDDGKNSISSIKRELINERSSEMRNDITKINVYDD
ncbi:15876_t:CDS:1, partial [Racocetra fulgida]